MLISEPGQHQTSNVLVLVHTTKYIYNIFRCSKCNNHAIMQV